MRAGTRRTSRGRGVTLARALSKAGVASRAEATRLIREGAVTVNGAIVRAPGAWVDTRGSRIALRGKPVGPARHIYIAMHKPRGIVTTRSDERGRQTVYSLLPPSLPLVFPVGRLDMDTSGLLLLTNDTHFGERIAGAAHGVPKTYLVTLDRPLEPPASAAIRRGVVLPGGERCRPAHLELDARDPRSCRLIITEGKNRQVRRMFSSEGYTVVALRRIAVGCVRLGSMNEGEVRLLTADELSGLMDEGGDRGPA
ncbi:MAG TPA: pseudouridine synthase [Bacteroidota bacterium]|nr:pseudouridine synthase [Bacteroidota bacterium]